MKFYCNLMMSDILIAKKERVISDIENRKASFNRFVIVLSEKENLEIHSTMALSKSVWKDKEWFVVGIATGYADALDMIKNLTQLVYNDTKDANLKEYILNKQEQWEKENCNRL